MFVVRSLTSRLDQLRRTGGFFFPGPRARVRVTGADRLRYLNGQLSNDLRRLAPGEAMAALLLTGKGKLCADVLVWIDGDAFVVEADASLVESLPARLERYAVSDDVTFELMPRDLPLCHVFGAVSAGEAGVRVRRLGVEGVDLARAPENLMEAGKEEVELLRIERGIPRWGNELSEDTLPQEAGLEQVAVDFKKGCYVGQEVVSRIESVGRVNRHLCGFVGDFDPAETRGATLLAAGGHKAGRLTSAAYHPELERTVSLGYVQSQIADPSFSVFDESGACLGEVERSEFPLVSS
ncbi:MAG: glycine cleavage T C-terminal barrel domain-containing protein [Terrimicrobiaceae bacterium]